MIPKIPECFDSEVMQLIQDLELVQFGSSEHREHLAMLAVQGVGTFDEQFQADYRNDLEYIMKGLNPRYHAFRKSQDELFACVNGKLF